MKKGLKVTPIGHYVEFPDETDSSNPIRLEHRTGESFIRIGNGNLDYGYGLNQETVSRLLPILTKFAETGKIG